ncbi:MAG TPA: uracil-DNA glycosylase [Desulfomonilia bacterium]|nr:uracil-DNA glycosylase [Desulfomonilia bacterium]
MREQIIQLLRDEVDWAGPYLLLQEQAISRPAQQVTQGSEEHELEEIVSAITGCTSCPLSRTRKNIVPGEGNPHALIMFVGEAPGAVEDETGRPFVGPAGNLLTDIIEKGMGIKRQEVYIANILKCRPPGNRDPQPDEITMCIGFLKAQIEAVNPKVIVALGRIAAHALLNDSTPISKLRGTFREFQGILTMPTYHPSYLLQNPSKKRDVWEDIKKVMEALGIPLQR